MNRAHPLTVGVLRRFVRCIITFPVSLIVNPVFNDYMIVQQQVRAAVANLVPAMLHLYIYGTPDFAFHIQ